MPDGNQVFGDGWKATMRDCSQALGTGVESRGLESILLLSVLCRLLIRLQQASSLLQSPVVSSSLSLLRLTLWPSYYLSDGFGRDTLGMVLDVPAAKLTARAA